MSGYIGPLPVPQGIQRKQSFTATAGQTTFNTNGYTDGNFITVYLNGVRLINGTDYTATNGSDVVLTTAAAASDVLDFETFQTFSLVDQQFENLTLKNPTHEDTDGGRESAVTFKGEQSGGEITTLAQIQASHDGTSDDQKGDLIFKTNDGSDNDAPTERMRIDSSGDVTLTGSITLANGESINSVGGIKYIADSDNDAPSSGAIHNFFTDNGSTSALAILKSGSVGIGDTAPDNVLNIKESALSGRSASNGNTSMTLEHATDTGIQFFSATQTQLRFGDAAATGAGSIIYTHSDNAMKFSTDESEAMRIDSDGDLGIGETNPTSRLTVAKESSRTNDTENMIRIAHSTSGTSAVGFGSKIAFIGERSNGTAQAQGNIGFVADVNTASDLSSAFVVDTAAAGVSTERIRIDSSGRLLIGRTTDTSAAGHTLSPLGFVRFVRSHGAPCLIDRRDSDGDLFVLRKDGSNIGAIVASGGTIVYAGNSHGLMINGSSVSPSNEAGSRVDNTMDIGESSFRFDDIRATNGTIQTSDENEKQDIASLTSAEITAATAISKLFKTYKWKDKVAAKGDDARTHTGIVAQQVQAAMSDAGLDVSKYAFWCSDTWWQKDIEFAAVEAVEAKNAVYDDDGKLVSEAVEEVEAQDAYTITKTYNSKDEAPEDATEHTRLGVRYPELLAFIGAATEQRLTSIESRLTALEGE